MKLVREHIEFERGLEPKDALKIGRKELIEKWLKKYANNFPFYDINDDLTINIGSGDFISDDLSKGFPDYIQFKFCGGYFDLDDSKIPSLRGCPEIVKGYFSCQSNDIISLEGMPKEIKGECYIMRNKKSFSEKEIRGYSKIGGTIETD